MEELKISSLYDLEETIAKELFSRAEYPWELLSGIGAFIVELGESLPTDRYEERGEHIWIAKNAKVYPTAYINGPCIIDEEALCFYTGERHRGQRGGGRKFYRIEKRGSF